MDAVPLLPCKQLSSPRPLQMTWWRAGGRVVVRGVKVDQRRAVFVCPTSFHTRQAAGAVGCGAEGS